MSSKLLLAGESHEVVVHSVKFSHRLEIGFGVVFESKILNSGLLGMVFEENLNPAFVTCRSESDDINDE